MPPRGSKRSERWRRSPRTSRLAGQGSPSRYRRYESGRGLNYVECDHNPAAVLDLHLDEATRAWAGERLLALGERAGTELVRRAEVYDAAGHELERYDRLGRDVSRVTYHPDWLASLTSLRLRAGRLEPLGHTRRRPRGPGRRPWAVTEGDPFRDGGGGIRTLVPVTTGKRFSRSCRRARAPLTVARARGGARESHRRPRSLRTRSRSLA